MTLLSHILLGFSVVVLVGMIVVLLLNPKLFLLIYKNLGRNLLRTTLTSMAIVVLVIMVTMIWSVVMSLDREVEEKSQDIKLIISERWQQPSQMPMSFSDNLNPNMPSALLPELKGYVNKGDFMTWSFYFGSTDPDPRKLALDNLAFAFVMNPDHIKTMMDDLQDTPDELVAALKADRRNILLGRERLQMLGIKSLPAKIKLYSINYKGLDLEFNVIGEMPGNRYDQIGILNVEYFDAAFEDYRVKKGQKHPLDDRRLSFIWLRVRDKDAVANVAKIIETSPRFSDRPLKCETASSGIAAWLDPYRDLLFGVKWLLVPAILASMTLVISNAIAITVRERRTEMAVLKVLGFRPLQIQILVLGEALLVGGLSGLSATLGAVAIINWVFGGIPFPIAWFPPFLVPIDALWWGFSIGAATGLLGSFLPAWTARSVKVSEVFSKVA